MKYIKIVVLWSSQEKERRRLVALEDEGQFYRNGYFQGEEFDTASQAAGLRLAMRVVWGRVDITIMTNLQARIVEIVEPGCSELASVCVRYRWRHGSASPIVGLIF